MATLPPDVLLALGLDTDVSETADTGDTDHIGPCLDVSVGPCLSTLPPKDCGCDIADGAAASWMIVGALTVAVARRRTRSGARRAVLDSGVLPEDIAALLDDG